TEIRLPTLHRSASLCPPFKESLKYNNAPTATPSDHAVPVDDFPGAGLPAGAEGLARAARLARGNDAYFGPLDPAGHDPAGLVCRPAIAACRPDAGPGAKRARAHRPTLRARAIPPSTGPLWLVHALPVPTRLGPGGDGLLAVARSAAPGRRAGDANAISRRS